MTELYVRVLTTLQRQKQYLVDIIADSVCMYLCECVS